MYFDIALTIQWWFQRHFTSLSQQGTHTTLCNLSPWGDWIRQSLITVHYACPPYVLLVPILHLYMVEQVCDLGDMLSISTNGNFSSDSSGDQTLATHTEDMLPNCYTTTAHT